MGLETIHEFEMCGCRFLVLWSTSSCLLRVTEGYASGELSSYMAEDLDQLLCDGINDFHLTQEEAIRAAPQVAERILVDARHQELSFMPQLVDSPELQTKYPVYRILRLRNSYSEKAVMVWTSHIHNLYLERNGSWEWVASPSSFEEALKCLEDNYQLTVEKQGKTRSWWQRLFRK